LIDINEACKYDQSIDRNLSPFRRFMAGFGLCERILVHLYGHFGNNAILSICIHNCAFRLEQSLASYGLPQPHLSVYFGFPQALRSVVESQVNRRFCWNVERIASAAISSS